MVNENNYSCCIIGHRKIEDLKSIKNEIYKIIIELIENKNVTTFNFGYYGEFNDFCYKTLLNLKEKYPQIQLVLYSLNNEIAYTFEEAEQYQIQNKRKNNIFQYKCFDKIIYLYDIDETKFKYACVLRNKKLIDESDYCIFHYRHNYILPNSRNSGTKIAYEYACERNKKILIS